MEVIIPYLLKQICQSSLYVCAVVVVVVVVVCVCGGGGGGGGGSKALIS